MTEEISITNFSWVIPDKLAGSSQPGNVDNCLKNDLKFLKENGIDAIVSLNENSTTLKPDLLKEYGFNHLVSPIPDYRGPTLDQCQQICSFIDANSKTLVHCNAGMGRTGTVLACYLIKSQGLDALSAIKKLRTERKGSIQTFKQEDSLKEWEAFLKSQQ